MTVEPLELFYSCAQADAALRGELAIHLTALSVQGLIKPWDNQEILPGSLRAQVINTHLQKADIILLLVSPDYIASEDCYSVELQEAIKKHTAGDVIVIPILLRPCDWKTAPFGGLQVLPRNGRPVVTWPNRDEAFAEIAQEIRALIHENHSSRARKTQAQALLKVQDLSRLAEKEHGVTISFSSVKPAPSDLVADYTVDWCDNFVGDTFKKGHQLKDPEAWNSQLLPELEALEVRVKQETHARLVMAWGQARLPPWFAFGFVFSQVAGYTIEIDQNGALWRTDAIPSRDFELVIAGSGESLEGEIVDGEGSSVAVGISVSGDLGDDVRSYLKAQGENIAALLLLKPDGILGDRRLCSDSDAIALVDGAKSLMRSFVRRWNAKRLLLFYQGPFAGACFLGYKLNAVCSEIQIMEYLQPGYAPSFLLK